MSRLLAITMRVEVDNRYRESRDAVAKDWWSFLNCAVPEVVPVILPNDAAMAQRLLDATDPLGLILTGGNDIGSCARRDAAESAVLGWMLKRKRPVLGVCRGMQFMVCQFGGRLSRVPHEYHGGVRHGLIIHENPLSCGIDHISRSEVNSYHSWQAIPDEDGPFKIWATSSDGGIEAIHARELSLMGIMWHPEREKSFHPFDLALFANHFYREREISCAQ
jgi:gamma-glutamyl-gamma-aminobutyrate hydrolase PuuD